PMPVEQLESGSASVHMPIKITTGPGVSALNTHATPTARVTANPRPVPAYPIPDRFGGQLPEIVKRYRGTTPGTDKPRSVGCVTRRGLLVRRGVNLGRLVGARRWLRRRPGPARA